jgi:hypothetical protein
MLVIVITARSRSAYSPSGRLDFIFHLYNPTIGRVHPRNPLAIRISDFEFVIAKCLGQIRQSGGSMF